MIIVTHSTNWRVSVCMGHIAKGIYLYKTNWAIKRLQMLNKLNAR